MKTKNSLKKKDEDLDEMKSEYDLRKLPFIGRGIYAQRYRSGTNLVLLETDVRKAFPGDESVNDAPEGLRENSDERY